MTLRVLEGTALPAIATFKLEVDAAIEHRLISVEQGTRALTAADLAEELLQEAIEDAERGAHRPVGTAAEERSMSAQRGSSLDAQVTRILR